MANKKLNSLLPPLWVLAILLLGVLGWLAYELKEILVFLVIGYCIAYILEPVLCRMEKEGISRPLGLLVVLICGSLFLALLIMTALPTLVGEFTSLAENLPRYTKEAQAAVVPYLQGIRPYLPDQLADQLSKDSILEALSKSSGEIGQKILQGVWATLVGGYSVALAFANLLILPFIVYYLAIDFKCLHRKALQFFPFLHREKVAASVRRIDGYVSAYVRGQLSVGLILTVLYAIGLGVVGVDLWFLLAIISGLGNLIPYVGFFIGIVLSSIMALVTFGDITHLILVWLVFVSVQVLEGTVITPKIVGTKVGLSPLVVILGLLAGGSLFGLLGIFLAVPVIAVIRVLGENLHYWLRTQHAI